MMAVSDNFRKQNVLANSKIPLAIIIFSFLPYGMVPYGMCLWCGNYAVERSAGPGLHNSAP